MAFTPLALGTASAAPVPTTQQRLDLIPCGPLNRDLVNGLLKLISDRLDAVDAADNAIASAVYDDTTNALTFTMLDGPAVVVPLGPLIADAVGTGLITSTAYNAATNVLTLTTVNGDVIPISMSALLADAVATGLITSSAYVAATNILTLTTANGDNIAIDMTSILADAVATALIPVGNIMMRADNTVPSGWALCDGTLGTPDLRDRFVIGASETLLVGTVGGSATHTHAAATTGSTTLTEAMTPPHNHHIVAAGTNTGAPTGNAAIAESSVSGGDSEYSLDIGFGSASLGLSSTPVDSAGGPIAAEGHAHTTPALAITQLPPHYALIFIMKL